MSSLFSKIKKASFLKNILVLMTGTSLAQAIPIIFSPVLTRLYSPEDFGILSLFVSVVTILSSVVTARYELAIVLPKTREESAKITCLAIIISIILSIIFLLCFIIFNRSISLWLGDSEIGVYLYFAPLAIFFNGLFNALKYYHIREKKFAILAKSTVYKSISSITIQMLLGIMSTKSLGLITGNISSYVSSNGNLIRGFYKENKGISKRLNLPELRLLAKKHIDFPKYSLSGVLANTLSQNIISVFISKIYSLFLLGQYSLVNRILGMPLILISNVVSDVFFQRATEEKILTGKARKSFIQTLLLLVSAAVIIFLPLYFFIEDLFSLVFGTQWAYAGKLAHTLLPLFFVRMVSSPLSMVLSIFNRQKNSLFINIILLISTCSVFGIAYSLGLSFEQMLVIWVTLLSFEYVFFLLYYFKIATK